MTDQKTGINRLAASLRTHRDRGLDSRINGGLIGVVAKVGADLGGLSVEIAEHGITLDSDNLLIGSPVAQYDADYGISVGDSLAILPTAAGDWIAVAVMTGTEQTDRGASFFAGTSAPGDGIGKKGDFYLNTATSRIYGPKTSDDTGWGSGTSLIGATGPTGPTGPAGSTGSTGPAGPGFDLHPFLWAS